MEIKLFKISFSALNILKFLFYIFPAAMLTSSGYITAYTSILTIFALYYFYYYKIKINFLLVDYLIIFFFVFSIISTFFNIKELGSLIFFKSILDFRFAILFFVIRNVINYEIINIKIFFNIALISSSFLSLNIFSQHLIGIDIFGHTPFDGRFNGLFESEAIAGSYIQKFSLFSILSILLFKTPRKINFFLTIAVVIILGLGILMTLDRMPFIMFLFSVLILLILLKKLRVRFLISIVVIIFLFHVLFNNYLIIKNRYSSILNEINFLNIKESIYTLGSKINAAVSHNEINDNKIELPGEYDYLKIYRSAYKVFLISPIIGSGVKSFGTSCGQLENKNQNINCSTHPHNIYLEILVNQGIIGMIIFLIFLAIVLKKKFFEILSNKEIDKPKLLNFFFLTALVTELLPIRSYGSIFQTVNGTFFWFFLAVMSSNLYIKNKFSRKYY
jgi:O-antigen ligase